MAQLNNIIFHSKFSGLEVCWRGLWDTFSAIGVARGGDGSNYLVTPPMNKKNRKIERKRYKKIKKYKNTPEIPVFLYK